ncbi:STAS domain-containing protein [Bacteroidota bacterium]
MEIKQKQINDFTVAFVNGRIDTTNYDVFENVLNKIVSSGQNNIVVDCEKMNYISSSGLRIFLVFLKQLNKNGGKFRICNMQKMVKEVFDVSGFSSLFEIYNSLDEAVL